MSKQRKVCYFIFSSLTLWEQILYFSTIYFIPFTDAFDIYCQEVIFDVCTWWVLSTVKSVQSDLITVLWVGACVNNSLYGKVVNCTCNGSDVAVRWLTGEIWTSTFFGGTFASFLWTKNKTTTGLTLTNVFYMETSWHVFLLNVNSSEN